MFYVISVKRLPLLPLVLLLSISCEKHPKLKRGDRIYYRYDSNAGYEKTVGLENGDDDFPDHVWFISEEYDNWQDSIMFRAIDNNGNVTEGELRLPKVLWIKKHPEQLPMPPLND